MEELEGHLFATVKKPVDDGSEEEFNVLMDDEVNRPYYGFGYEPRPLFGYGSTDGPNPLAPTKPVQTFAQLAKLGAKMEEKKEEEAAPAEIKVEKKEEEAAPAEILKPTVTRRPKKRRCSGAGQTEPKKAKKQ